MDSSLVLADLVVVRGQPTPEELEAVVAVLAATLRPRGHADPAVTCGPPRGAVLRRTGRAGEHPRWDAAAEPPRRNPWAQTGLVVQDRAVSQEGERVVVRPHHSARPAPGRVGPARVHPSRLGA